MPDFPFTFQVNLPEMIPSHYDQHTRRTLSSMRGQYLGQVAYQALLAKEDTLVYEVYEITRPEKAGELPCGISIVHPGKVGDEFFMTKGHFHRVLDTGEVYNCLQGQGCVVMETPEGETSVAELSPGKILYIPPRWAHRSVNTSSDQDLITFYVYPGNAGHDYGTIEEQGFAKVVLSRSGKVEIADNPRWRK